MPKKDKNKNSAEKQQLVLDEETLLQSISEDNSLLYKHEQQALSNHFQKMLNEQFSLLQENQDQSKKIVFSNFGLDQIWQQLKHHTEKLNSKTLNKLQNLTLNDEFNQQIEEINQNEESEEQQSKSEGDEAEQGPEDDDEMSDGYKEMMRQNELDGGEEGEDIGDEDEGDEAASDALSGDQLDEFMEDQEEMDDNNGKLKIPDDVRGDPDDEYDQEDDQEDDQEPTDVFGAGSDNDAEDAENDIFAMARENKELAQPAEKFANQDMGDKIDRIENDMMDKSKWQMKGEVQCKDRNYNSLLEEHVDFDTATKAPPQITQETTNEIEAMIKQRILDELFDDPIRKAAIAEKKDNDFLLNFQKSGEGLAEEYSKDYAKKLMAQNKDVFLDNDVTGVDSVLKKEIQTLFDGVMRNLNQLSNVHYTPKKMTKESAIRTQNVPALQLEEAIPIGVSTGMQQTAKEVFTIAPQQMRDKAELTKEERHRERAHRKRQIGEHLRKKEITRKEKNREKGLAQVGDKFLVKQVKEQMQKKKKGEKKNKELGIGQDADKNKNEFKSGKFFNKMQEVQKGDKEKKELKRMAKEKGVAMESFHNNVSAKRFKM